MPRKISICLFFFTINLYTQAINNLTGIVSSTSGFSLCFYGTRISSTEIQDNITSDIPFLRDASSEMKGGFGYGAEIEYNPSISKLELYFYVSAEYIKIDDDDFFARLSNDSARATVSLFESFYMIPLEAGIKWKLPVSTELLTFYIGGGYGVYFGKRKRNLAYLDSYNISTKAGYSLNVLTGVDYRLTRNLAVNFELKFREGYFESQDTYNTGVINVDGQEFAIQDPFSSRILISGARLSLGIKYIF
jgi:opacity protein-like surface antigen